MDPDQLLREIRQLTADILAGGYALGDEPAFELAEKVNDLDEWLSKEGFPPAVWLSDRTH